MMIGRTAGLRRGITNLASGRKTTVQAKANQTKPKDGKGVTCSDQRPEHEVMCWMFQLWLTRYVGSIPPRYLWAATALRTRMSTASAS